MKIKGLFILLIILSILSINVKANTCNPDKVSIESISTLDKTNNVEEIEEASKEGKNIKLNLSMSDVGDYIKYKLIIKNDSNEDYKLAEKSLNIESDYMNYSFELEDNSDIIKANSSKIIYLKVEYQKEIPSEELENDVFNEKKAIPLNILDNEITNPDTKRNIIILSIIVLIIISTILISIKNKKYLKPMILIIGIALPIITYALCDANIEIELKLKIKKSIVEIITPNRTKDTLQVGDEICINGDTTECFNFIGYDGNNIKMLSKWNLKVGGIYDSGNNKIGEYTSSDTGYGLQSSDIRGKINESSTYNGTVAFSGTNYWAEGSNIKAKYGNAWNTNNIYDTDYSDATGVNYSVAYYVENYKDTLEDYGATVQEARLLRYVEATDVSIGCNVSTYRCPTNSFIVNTTFWIESVKNSSGVIYVSSDGIFTSLNYSKSYNNGIRPVIVISKSNIF